MSAVFSKPKTPTLPKPITPPTRDEAKIAADESTRLRKRQGRASTILTQSATRTAQAGEAAKTKLGM